MQGVSQDRIGNIAIIKFPRGKSWLSKKVYSLKLIKKNKDITTVLEKTEKFSGRLRKLKTKHLAGIKTKTALYRENDCLFKLNVDETYFSSRLSNERKITSEKILKLLKTKKSSKILVMFSGVGPYPITIARKFKLAKKKAEIYSNEINKKANQFEKENIKLNNLSDYVRQVPGDIKNLPPKLKGKKKFDVILMPRPNLKETFLKTAIELSKKDTTIMYYGFGTKEKVLEEIKSDLGKTKISKITTRRAGDIAVKKFRWLVSFKILSK